MRHRNARFNPPPWLHIIVVYLFFYKSSLLKELPVLLQHSLLSLQSLEITQSLIDEANSVLCIR